MMLRFFLGIFTLSLVWASLAFSAVHSNRLQAIYLVKEGDTLYTIAHEAHIPSAELKWLNRLTDDELKPGQLLNLGKAVPPVAETPTVTENISRQPAAADEKISLLEKTALGFLKMPYRYGGIGKKGIDCSGLVQQVFKSVSVQLPHSTRKQYLLGTKVAQNDLQIGDLLFFHSRGKHPTHVGIYIGNDKMIHASSRDRGVVITDIGSGYFRERYLGARRLDFAPEESTPNRLLSESRQKLGSRVLENSEPRSSGVERDIDG